jgi:hypothetical protein
LVKAVIISAVLLGFAIHAALKAWRRWKRRRAAALERRERERRRERRRRGPTLPPALATLLASLLLAPGCVRTAVQSMGPREPGGVAAPAPLLIDDRPSAISACLSGDRGYFLGVDLIARASDVRLRVLMDPLDGPRLKLFRPDQGAADVLGPEQCSELRASVRPTGWRVNHVRDVAGELAASCALRDGGRLEARVTFEHCH